MFSSRNKKNNVYPCKPQVYYIKVGLRGSKLYRHVFVMRFGYLANHRVPCDEWSDNADAQAGLCLRLAHMQSCRKCRLTQSPVTIFL